MGFIENVNYLVEYVPSISENMDSINKVAENAENLPIIVNDLENIDKVADDIESVRIIANSIDDINTYANDTGGVYETSLALTNLLNTILNKIEALRNRVRLEIGTILTYPVKVNNKFLLELNGQKVLKKDYPDLWNLVKDYVIKDTDKIEYAGYFKDIDENYFRLPDYSGDLTVKSFDIITKTYNIKYLPAKYYIIAKSY